LHLSRHPSTKPATEVSAGTELGPTGGAARRLASIEQENRTRRILHRLTKEKELHKELSMKALARYQKTPTPCSYSPVLHLLQWFLAVPRQQRPAEGQFPFAEGQCCNNAAHHAHQAMSNDARRKWPCRSQVAGAGLLNLVTDVRSSYFLTEHSGPGPGAPSGVRCRSFYNLGRQNNKNRPGDILCSCSGYNMHGYNCEAAHRALASKPKKSEDEKTRPTTRWPTQYVHLPQKQLVSPKRTSGGKPVQGHGSVALN
jgi:hypothetical protein